MNSGKLYKAKKDLGDYIVGPEPVTVGSHMWVENPTRYFGKNVVGRQF